jgi:hypothetical protein
VPEDIQHQIKYLEEAIGNTRVGGSLFADVNFPVVTPMVNFVTNNPINGFSLGLYGVLLSIPEYREYYNKKISRRTFLLSSVGTIGGIAGLGAALGWANSQGTINELNAIKQNAIYLDNMYSKLFPT